MPRRIEKTVFISYRRTNLPWALAIYQNLTHHGYDVFFDYQSINSGDFEQIILGNIRARAHFIVLLTPTALERCASPADWMRREIETGLDEKRNVIPLFLEGFSFGNPNVANYLTGKIAWLQNYNGLSVPSDYFDEAMERLRQRYLNVSLETVLHPVTPVVQRAVIEQQKAANRADETLPPANFKLAAINQNTSYVFFYARNGAWWNGIPEPLAEKIRAANAQDDEFKWISLGPNSSWVFLHGHNAYWWSGISNNLVQKLQQANSEGHEFKSVTLGPAGSWVFFYGHNSYWWQGISDLLAQKLQEAYSQGYAFKSVALGPNGSWVFLYDYNAYWWQGIPDLLAQKLQEAYSQGYEFKSVTLGPNGSWVFMYGHNGFWSDNIPPELLNKLHEIHQ